MSINILKNTTQINNAKYRFKRLLISLETKDLIQ